MARRSDTPPAIVLAKGITGLAAVRSLTQAGVPTIALFEEGEPIQYSRLAAKMRVPANPGDAELLAQLQKCPRGSVVLVTSDELLGFVVRNRAALSERFRLAVPPDRIARMLLDKAEETRQIAALGVPIAKTVAQLPAAPEELLAALTLPILFKPVSQLHQRQLGRKNILARSLEDVRRIYREHGMLLPHLIAQEYIPSGRTLGLWQCLATFDENSRLASAFTFAKIRTTPPRTGVTAYGVSCKNAAVIENTRQFGQLLGYVGPAELEFKLDERDGTYKYIETNGRLTMCDQLATTCGVNVAFAAYRVALGQPLPREAPQRDGVCFLHTFEDVYCRYKDGESWRLILRDMIRLSFSPKVLPYFSWNDPAPAMVVGGEQLANLLRHRAKQKEGSDEVVGVEEVDR